MPERPYKRHEQEEIGYIRNDKCPYCKGTLLITVPDFSDTSLMREKMYDSEYWYMKIPKAMTYCHICYPSPKPPYRNLAGLSEWCKWKGGEYVETLNTVVFISLAYNVGYYGAVRLFKESDPMLDILRADIERINACLKRTGEANDNGEQTM